MGAAHYEPAGDGGIQLFSLNAGEQEYENTTTIQLVRDSDTTIPEQYIEHDGSKIEWDGTDGKGSHISSDVKVQVDYTLAEDYEAGTLQVSIPKIVLENENTIPYPILQCGYELGGGTNLWEMELEEAEVVLTNKIPMHAGSNGYFQLKYTQLYAGYWTKSILERDVKAVWTEATSGKRIMETDAILFCYEGLPMRYAITTVTNIDVDKCGVDLTTYLSEEEMEKYKWTGYQVAASGTGGIIALEKGYYLITLPQGARFLNTSNSVGKYVGETAAKEKQYLFEYPTYTKCVIGYEKDTYTEDESITVTVDLIGSYRFDMKAITELPDCAGIEDKYGKTAEAIRGIVGEPSEGASDWYYLSTRSLTKNISELDFQYSGSKYRSLFVDLLRKFTGFGDGTLHGTPVLIKNRMESEEGERFCYQVSAGSLEGYDYDIGIGGDYVYYNTQNDGMKRAAEDEYGYTTAFFHTSRIWIRHPDLGVWNYTENDTINLEYNLLYRTEGTHTYKKYYPENLPLDHEGKEIKIEFPKEENVVDVQLVLYGVPAGRQIDGDLLLELEGWLKPKEFSNVLPNEEVETEGKGYFLSYIKTYKHGTDEWVDKAKKENYVQTLGGEIAEELTGLDEANHQGCMIRRKAEPIIQYYRLTGSIYKEMGEASYSQRLKGWQTSASVQVIWDQVWTGDIPDGISGFTAYDLLPEGMEYRGGQDGASYTATTYSKDILESIYPERELSLQNKIIPKEEVPDYIRQHCTFTAEEDYRGTGRTMLKWVFDFSDDPLDANPDSENFKAVLPDIQIEFPVFISQSNYKKFNGEFFNYAALTVEVPKDETGADTFEVYGGRKDDGTWAKNDDSSAWANLDGDETNDSAGIIFFGGSSMGSSHLEYGHEGVRKLVRTDRNRQWTEDAVTSSGAEYSYLLNVSSAGKYRLGDIVLYDILETAEGSEWKGTFAGVDVSDAVSMGAAPKVYYATAETDSQDLTDTSVWTAMEDYQGDLADVRAVAVDLRKKADGGSFYLVNAESVNVYVKMKAPAGEEYKEKVTCNSFSVQMNCYDTFDKIAHVGDTFSNITKVHFEERKEPVDPEPPTDPGQPDKPEDSGDEGDSPAPGGGSSSASQKTVSAKTGDTAAPGFWILAAVFSACAAAVLLRRREKTDGRK